MDQKYAFGQASHLHSKPAVAIVPTPVTSAGVADSRPEMRIYLETKCSFCRRVNALRLQMSTPLFPYRVTWVTQPGPGPGPLPRLYTVAPSGQMRIVANHLKFDVLKCLTTTNQAQTIGLAAELANMLAFASC